MYWLWVPGSVRFTPSLTALISIPAACDAVAGRQASSELEIAWSSGLRTHATLDYRPSHRTAGDPANVALPWPGESHRPASLGLREECRCMCAASVTHSMLLTTVLRYAETGHPSLASLVDQAAYVLFHLPHGCNFRDTTNHVSPAARQTTGPLIAVYEYVSRT